MIGRRHKEGFSSAGNVLYLYLSSGYLVFYENLLYYIPMICVLYVCYSLTTKRVCGGGRGTFVQKKQKEK